MKIGEMKAKKSWLDLVKEYFPNATERDCDIILWEYTAFPVADIDTIKKQLKDLKEWRDGK